MKNAYVGRTFIQPSQTIRQLGIRLKLNPLRDVIRGKRLVVVDDSIVRGNTQRALVRMLREAGALEVHVRIASPPVQLAVLLRHRLRHPRRAGRQRRSTSRACAARSAPTRSATSRSTGLVAASEQPRTRLCTACFDGDYPIPLPAEARLGKHLLEGLVRARRAHAVGRRLRRRVGRARPRLGPRPTPSPPAGGAADALDRP